jgi:hypothetical protein
MSWSSSIVKSRQQRRRRWWLEYTTLLLLLPPTISVIPSRRIPTILKLARRIPIRDQWKDTLVASLGSISTRRCPKQQQQQQERDWILIIQIRGGNNDNGINAVGPPTNPQKNDVVGDDGEKLSSSFHTNITTTTTATTTTIDSQTVSTWRVILTKIRQSMVSEQTKEQWQQIFQLLQQLTSRLGPTLLTILVLQKQFNRNLAHQHGSSSIFTMYGLALLGASCGFHFFLYFITLGFALGVTIPLVVSLFVYQVKTNDLLERSGSDSLMKIAFFRICLYSPWTDSLPLCASFYYTETNQLTTVDNMAFHCYYSMGSTIVYLFDIP